MNLLAKNVWHETTVLIWGKTYPELSTKYYETVCTGGVLPDGRFIRLYPIPFRYLSSEQSFSKYQWLRLRIMKSRDDPRPESFKIDPESIEVLDKVEADSKVWARRTAAIFKSNDYQFASAEHLFAENKTKKTSMGFVRPRSIDSIEIDIRPDSELEAFYKKLEANRQRSQQTDLFGLSVEEVKALEFVKNRFKIHWHCDDPKCNGHKMSILDWEAYELARKVGIDETKKKLATVLDMQCHDLGFFLGNFRQYPNTFAIGGIWYPKKLPKTDQYSLF